MEQLKVNQQKNTQKVLDWFIEIEEKNNHKFIMLDIKDLYPSLKGTLLTKAMNFAKKCINIPNRENELSTMQVDLFYTTIMNHEEKRQRFI